MKEITGIILAGGNSSRMGEDKGLLELNGKSMIEHVIKAVQPLVSDIIIISNQEEYEQFGYTVFEDEYKDKGPMGGIYTGLKNSMNKTNFILSCDIPLIHSDFLEWLLNQHEKQPITVSEIKGRENHMIGVYERSIIGQYKQSIQQNDLKLKITNKKIGCQIVQVDENQFPIKLFSNINTKEDYLAL